MPSCPRGEAVVPYIGDTMLVLPILALALVQDTFADTPEHPWAAQGQALAKREGILIGYPSNCFGISPRPPSRYEIAIAYHAMTQNQLGRLEAFLQKPTSDVERASLLRSAALLPFYKKAATEFRREFRSLGIEGDLGQSRLADLTRRIASDAPARTRLFRDVPADHWAAKAVGDLRALGLLDGYPDGLYRKTRD